MNNDLTYFHQDCANNEKNENLRKAPENRTGEPGEFIKNCVDDVSFYK